MRIFYMILSIALIMGPLYPSSEAFSMPETKEQRLSIVQAAIIYQLTKYIKWDKHERDGLLLCIYTNKLLRQELERIIESKNERKIQVHNNPDYASSCDLVYLPEISLTDYSFITAAYAAQPVLFVSSGPSFIDMGGMVSLVERQGKVTIELNMQLLRSKNFNVSPSLIEIAARVIK
jgi:hypothetical protein